MDYKGGGLLEGCSYSLDWLKQCPWQLEQFFIGASGHLSNRVIACVTFSVAKHWIGGLMAS